MHMLRFSGIGRYIVAAALMLSTIFVASHVTANTSSSQEGVSRVGDGRSVGELLFASSMTAKEVGQIMSVFGVAAYSMPHDSVTLESEGFLVIGTLVTMEGNTFTFGDRPPAGTRVRSGILWNVELTEAAVSMAQYADISVMVPVGEALVVNYVVDAQPIADSDSGSGGTPPLECSVTCDSGFWACCYFDATGIPRCKCYNQASIPNDCHSGGQGAVSCALSQPTPPTSTPPKKPKKGMTAAEEDENQSD